MQITIKVPICSRIGPEKVPILPESPFFPLLQHNSTQSPDGKILEGKHCLSLKVPISFWISDVSCPGSLFVFIFYQNVFQWYLPSCHNIEDIRDQQGHVGPPKGQFMVQIGPIRTSGTLNWDLNVTNQCPSGQSKCICPIFTILKPSGTSKAM